MTAEAITFGRGKAPRVLAKSFTPRLRVQTPKRLQLLVCILGRGDNCIIPRYRIHSCGLRKGMRPQRPHFFTASGSSPETLAIRAEIVPD